MAARDHAIPVRTAVIEALKGYGPVAAMVGDRVYSEEVPDENDPEFGWPYVAWGSPLETPFEASGMAGSEMRLTVHAFARGPGEDECRKLARLLADHLETLAPCALRVEDDELGEGEAAPGPVTLRELYWFATNVTRDPSTPRNYHAVVEFTATTATPA